MVSHLDATTPKVASLSKWLSTARCRLTDKDYQDFRAAVKVLFAHGSGKQVSELPSVDDVLWQLAELLWRADFPEGIEEHRRFMEGFCLSLPKLLIPTWEHHIAQSAPAGAEEPGTPPKPLTLMQRSEIFCKRVAPVEEAPDEPERKLSRRDSNASSCVEVLTAPDADPPLELRQAAATKGPRPVGPQASAAVGPRPVGPQAPSEDGLGWEIVDQPSMLPKVPVPRPVGPQEMRQARQPKLCTICHFEADRPEVSALCGHFACQACWGKWLTEKLECPVCRCKVRSQNLVLLKGWDS